MAANRRKSNDRLWAKSEKREIPGRGRRLRFNGKSLYIIIPVLLCCILIIANMIQYFHFYRVSNAIYEICSHSSNESELKGLVAYANNLDTANLLNTGLTIISIAVTIWIGLNIYNVVNKEDVEKTLGEYDKRIIDLDKDREKRLQFFTKKAEFVNLLYLTGNQYCASEFFANLFWNTKEEYSNIDNVIKCERKYIQCCTYYENNRKEKANRLACELMDEYKELMSEPPYTTCSETDPMKNFLRMRLSDAIFYKNMTVPIEKLNLTEVEKSVRYYEDIINNPSEIRVWDDVVLAYFYNSQGYLIYNMGKHISNKLCDKNRAYMDAAQKKLKEATRKAPFRGRYKRNLGLVYQFQDDKKTAETYKDAMKTDPLDCKAYNTVAALSLKKIDKDCGINDRVEKNVLLDEMDFSGEAVQKYLKDIDDDIVWCRIAEKINFSQVDTHFNMAKAYLYKYLWEGRENSEFLKIAHEQIGIAERLSSDTAGTMYVKRNIYEAEGKFEEALECANNKLIIKSGDNPGLLKKYGERVEQT